METIMRYRLILMGSLKPTSTEESSQAIKFITPEIKKYREDKQKLKAIQDFNLILDKDLLEKNAAKNRERRLREKKKGGGYGKNDKRIY